MRLRISCYLTLGATLAVMGFLIVSDKSFALTLILLAPFAVVLPGLVQGWYRSYSWLSLMILVYFIVAITQVMAPDGNWADGTYVALTVIIFFAATFSSRWLQQRHFNTDPKQTNTKQNNINN